MKTLNDICDSIINYDGCRTMRFQCRRCGQDINVRVPLILLNTIEFNCFCGYEYRIRGIDYD